MKKSYIIIYSLILLSILAIACTAARADKETSKTVVSAPTITQTLLASSTTKPWTRWWWHGSSVTRSGITRELEYLHASGIGGVEITPIYGQQGDEKNFVSYLSPEWVDLLVFTLNEADRLGMGVDMATGTGWPFGGPWVGPEDACKNLRHQKYILNTGEHITEKLSYTQEPLLRTVRPIEQTIADIKYPISDNDDLQALALDQVRFERELPLIALMAYGDDGQVIDLMSSLTEDQLLDWTAPAGSWEIYALYQGWHGKMVERAAPGGEGNVPDHFSKAAIQRYLDTFGQAIAEADISSLRAFFNDSYEVDDASGQGDWTPDLFAEFEERRGYDLKAYLPALLSEEDSEISQRVRTDYRATINDLLLEHFTQVWSDWAHDQDAIIRNQAHGSPANILDLYAASDIPETEGTDLIKAKMASSAAHVTGKKLVSAEAATWLDEHFLSDLGDLKQNIDRYFAAGINHIVYHGTCYTPADMEWPGRLFYAAIHANDRNPLWQDYPAFNQYVTNVQQYLQLYAPDNDILLYLPAYDRYARESHGLLEHFDGWATPKSGKDSSAVRKIAEQLLDQGHSFDFISDLQVTQLLASDGQPITHGRKYKCIVIPRTEYMPLETLQQLHRLSAQDVTVIYEQWPESVPGLYELPSRQRRFDETLRQIISNSLQNENIDTALQQINVKNEALHSSGLWHYRMKTSDGHAYFIANWSGADIDEYIALAHTGEHISIMEPMQDISGYAQSNSAGEIRIQLKAGQSIIVHSSAVVKESRPYPYVDQAPKMEVKGPWKLSFSDGGPSLPESKTLPSLQYWTSLSGAPYQEFSGIGSYSTTFDLPKGNSDTYLLDLGELSESATILINGQKIGSAIGPSYQLMISADVLQSEDNTIEIRVANSMANRIRSIEKDGDRWQQFYNINISARKRENLGEDRVFTTKHWSPLPSGLAGPVTLTPVSSTK